MSYKNLVDIHMHTENSFDADCPADEMCESAIAKGLQTIAFTDHIEMDCFRKSGFDKTADESFADIVKTKEKYKDKIKLLVGVEMGEATYDKQESEKLISEKNYDIVIASIHNLRQMDDFYDLDYEKYDVDKLLKTYFDELIMLADWAKFDTMAHMTYPLRYIQGVHKIQVDMSVYNKQIDEVLSLLVKNDRALEINTSGLFQPLKKTLPDVGVVKKFKSLGGKYVTLGSDAHYSNKVGGGIERGMEIAEECGFKFVTVFEKRKPIEVPIK